jgi:hypothetical protein
LRVYKFLEKKWALEALRARPLKIARLDALNDPFELFPYESSNHAVSLMQMMTLREMTAKYGLVCFSASWTNPVMWAHYAEQHRGICLGFDIPEEIGQRVTYVDQRLPFPSLFALHEKERLRAAQSFLFTKFSSWSYEEEVRATLLLDPTTEEQGRFFVSFGPDLALAEIIIGSGVVWSSCARLEVSSATELLGSTPSGFTTCPAFLRRL